MEVDQEGNHECTLPPNEYLAVPRLVTLWDSKQNERTRKHSGILQEKDDTPEHSSISQEKEDIAETGSLWCHEAQQQLLQKVMKQHVERFGAKKFTDEERSRVMELWTGRSAASPANH